MGEDHISHFSTPHEDLHAHLETNLVLCRRYQSKRGIRASLLSSWGLDGTDVIVPRCPPSLRAGWLAAISVKAALAKFCD